MAGLVLKHGKGSRLRRPEYALWTDGHAWKLYEERVRGEECVGEFLEEGHLAGEALLPVPTPRGDIWDTFEMTRGQRFGLDAVARTLCRCLCIQINSLSSPFTFHLSFLPRMLRLQMRMFSGWVWMPGCVGGSNTAFRE